LHVSSLPWNQCRVGALDATACLDAFLPFQTALARSTIHGTGAAEGEFPKNRTSSASITERLLRLRHGGDGRESDQNEGLELHIAGANMNE
jgi:hypothetical protein